MKKFIFLLITALSFLIAPIAHAEGLMPAGVYGYISVDQPEPDNPVSVQTDIAVNTTFLYRRSNVNLAVWQKSKFIYKPGGDPVSIDNAKKSMSGTPYAGVMVA